MKQCDKCKKYGNVSSAFLNCKPCYILCQTYHNTKFETK